MITFRLLGSVEVVHDDAPIALGGPKQRALLALLLLNANRAVSTDQIADALWHERVPANAAKSLQMSIARLRRALEPLADPGTGESVLRTVHGGYLLAAPAEELDAAVLEERVREGRRALDGDDPGGAAAVLRSALALWRGPPLADIAFEEFVQPEARRLEALRLTALELRIEADLRLGAHESVIAELHSLTADHPFHEGLAAQLMRALYRCGRQAEALGAFERTRDHLGRELGLAPGPALSTLQAQIFAQDPELEPDGSGASAGPALDVRSNLPHDADVLIGRERELGACAALLAQDDVRMLTLTGPAGTGKTRLALRLAHEVQDRFADGVFVTFAAAIERVELVVPAIARTLELRERPDEAIDAVVARYVAGRELLLVIDNLEQVPEAAAALSRLLQAAPSVKLLVTSRVTLRVAAEHEFGVAPLEVPGSEWELEAALDAPSVRLFVRRAEAVDPDALDRERDLRLVGEICRRLDGLPLAIELAAARVRVLPVEALCDALDQRLSLLTTGRRDAPPRHQTLRAALDWSHQLLSAAERILFRRLAVFAGGFSLEAALHVCAPEELDGAAPVDILQALVESNLVRPVGTVAGVRRFMLLETMREYALERLAEAGENDAVRRQHAELTAATVERADLEFWHGGQSAWLPRLDAEHDNIRAAVAWAQHAGDATEIEVRLAGQLLGFAIVRGHWRELDGWLAHALPASEHTARALRVKCLWSAAVLAAYLGRPEEAGDHARRLLAISEHDGDQQARAYGLCALGLSRTSIEDGQADWERCVRVAEAIGDAHTLCIATGNLAGCAIASGRLDRAQQYQAQALALARQSRLEDLELYQLTTGAHIAYASNDIDTTDDLARQALPLAVQLGFKEALMYLFELRAGVCVRMDDAERAGRLLGAAERICEELGAHPDPNEDDFRSEVLDRLEHECGRETLDSLLDEGRAMPLAAVIAAAAAP